MPNVVTPAPGSFAVSAATTKPRTFAEDASRYAEFGVGMEVWEQKLDPARLVELFGPLRGLGVAVTFIQPGG